MSHEVSDRRRLDAQMPFVRDQLPTGAARVLEVGCGPLGGFVPALAADGHDAVGVDPDAPSAPGFHRLSFEEYDVPQPVDAIVASTSLHHVADLDRVLDRFTEILAPGGAVVVLEWAHEDLDEETARWCFDRAPAATDDEHQGWVQHHRELWEQSGQDWHSYLTGWAREGGLHAGATIITALDARFERRMLTRGPYLFADLDNVTAADEQAAIDNGRITATGIRYAGRRS